MTSSLVLIAAIFALNSLIADSCLITNCPRGGKRSRFAEENVKQCVSCGPAHSGQCFGSNICCGPFGCLIGTSETIRCQREGFFHEREPCIAGNAFCRKNTGRCAGEGICCTQESCHIDKTCSSEDKQTKLPMETLYGFMNQAYSQADYGNENVNVIV